MPSSLWLAFLGFVVALAIAAVWLARRSAEFVRHGEVPPAPVLYLNVVGTQAVVVALLVFAGWVAGIPRGAFSLGVTRFGAIAGLVAGVGVFVASLLATRVLSHAGVNYSEALRDALEPRSTSERLMLYLGALPAVAIGEESLFRGALVGAMAMGFGISPWIPALGSSALFGYAHSAQGKVGVVVTGVLGFVLAGVFIVTNSLLAAVVAHLVINALEFALGQRLTER